MIKYTVQCENEHQFEGWFASSAAFDEQKASGDLQCPVCETHAVEKALMAPAIPAKRQNQLTRAADATGVAETQTVATAEAVAETQKIFVEFARQVRQQVRENAEDVGDRFAEEARKIHYEEGEARNIYGKATKEEVESLLEDEIAILPLPELPEDRN